jgi:chemotaxis-related protein WspB
MKVLVFHIGADRYGLPLAGVKRVLPVVALKHIPLAPPFVAGLMDLHGEPVPVLDLSRLAGLAPKQLWFDTRISLVDYPLPGGASASRGLLAEHVSGIEPVDPGALREPGVGGAAFLGQVAGAAAGMLQIVELDHLLSAEVRALLFPARVAA